MGCWETIQTLLMLSNEWIIGILMFEFHCMCELELIT